MVAERKVELLMKSMGSPGKFQVISYLCLVTNMILIMSNHLAMVFFAAKTRHHCKLESGESVQDRVPMVTRNNEKQWDGCRLYAGNNASEILPCTNGWTYYLEDGEVTIISEFDLVCDDAYKAGLATSIYFAGVMLGALVLGFPADRFGRKSVVACLLFASGLLGIGIFFSKGYVDFVALRFFLGFTMQGILMSGFVLALELFQTKYRARAGVFYGVGSITGGAVCGILAYLIKDWRYIQLALTVLSFIQLLLLCFVPESLRWLLLKKKFQQAEAVVERVVAFNKLPFPRELYDEVKEGYMEEPCKPTREQKASFLDLFRSRTFRFRTIVLVPVWFTLSAAFYGLAFNISALFGNKYINFGISEASDMCTVLLMLWAVPRFGRRKPLGVAFLLCGMANVICFITNVVKSDSTSWKLVGTATALFGKSCVVCCSKLLYMFTSELYPTIIRSVSLGLNSSWSRIGGITAPQIFLLGRYMSVAVPYAILALLTLVTSFLIFLLPETHNQALLDRIEHTKPPEKGYKPNETPEVDEGRKLYETSL